MTISLKLVINYLLQSQTRVSFAQLIALVYNLRVVLALNTTTVEETVRHQYQPTLSTLTCACRQSRSGQKIMLFSKECINHILYRKKVDQRDYLTVN